MSKNNLELEFSGDPNAEGIGSDQEALRMSSFLCFKFAKDQVYPDLSKFKLEN